jgi:hypothetical protein
LRSRPGSAGCHDSWCRWDATPGEFGASPSTLGPAGRRGSRARQRLARTSRRTSGSLLATATGPLRELLGGPRQGGFGRPPARCKGRPPVRAAARRRDGRAEIGEPLRHWRRPRLRSDRCSSPSSGRLRAEGMDKTHGFALPVGCLTRLRSLVAAISSSRRSLLTERRACRAANQVFRPLSDFLLRAVSTGLRCRNGDNAGDRGAGPVGVQRADGKPVGGTGKQVPEGQCVHRRCDGCPPGASAAGVVPVAAHTVAGDRRIAVEGRI